MNNLVTISFAIIFAACIGNEQEQTSSLPPAEKEVQLNELYLPDEVYGPLFEQVQLTNVFPDNKTFVDCVPKRNPEIIVEAYLQLKSISDFDLKTFVMGNFNIPPDLATDFVSNLQLSPQEHIEALWPVLTRSNDEYQRYTTLIPLPHEYVVPGGRFREIYYWDSYFTMLGLHESGKHHLIEKMLDNFAFLIDKIGHIPNGNRSYYHTRSQPPFFSQMVKLYAEYKGEEVYQRYADALRKEYTFWTKHDKNLQASEHMVNVGGSWMNRYWDAGTTPRQESFKEDFELVEAHGGGEATYKDLRSGAESGWDFSSRWFADGKQLHTIETTNIIPVDLNALMYGLEKVLLKVETDPPRIKDLTEQMAVRRTFIEGKAWDKKSGEYRDYNWVDQEQTAVSSLAMVYPLFFKMVEQQRADKVARTIEDRFLKPGGVVSTLEVTGQQWDAPNGWAPLQWMTIMGLHNYGHTELALEIANRWTGLNEKVYANTGKFMEKYNVIDMELEAGGGEYDLQDGFGWSNGVYLACIAFIKAHENQDK